VKGIGSKLFAQLNAQVGQDAKSWQTPIWQLHRANEPAADLVGGLGLSLTCRSPFSDFSACPVLAN
jgi:hypothetical protein